jgi:NADH-quinone oxidoreductase subunit C
MSDDFVPALQQQVPSLTPRPSTDCPAFNCPVDQVPQAVAALKQLGFDMLVDVTAIDWEKRSPRFEVVYHLYATEQHRYVRLVAGCAGNEQPEAPSVTSLFPAADWHERETYDMFGIRFVGHPDLRRILMWEDYPHFPLRKEFPLAGIDTPLPDSEVAAETGATAKPAPLMGGPFVAAPEGPSSDREPRGKDQSWTEKREKPGLI